MDFYCRVYDKTNKNQPKRKHHQRLPLKREKLHYNLI